MKYLILMWAGADAASGDEADFQAWSEFDEQVKAAGAFVASGALQPAATGCDRCPSRAHEDRRPRSSRRPRTAAFAAGTRQIQAFCLMECGTMDTAVEWADRLPTYGVVEVRELIDY
jgi:hypothetical protein